MADILPPIKKSVTICKSSEFPPGTKHVVSVEGRNILVTNHKGSLFACDNACYHMGMPLQSGDIEDMNGSPCLTCPWHKYIIALDSGDGYYWGLEPSADGKPVKVLKGKGPRQRTYPLYENGDGNIQLDVDTTKGGEWASDEYAAKARVNKKEHVTCHLVDGNNNHNNNNGDDNNNNVNVDGEVTIHSRINTAGGQPPPGIHSSASGGGFMSSGQVFSQNKTSASGLAGSGGFSLRARALAQARLVQAGSNNTNNNDDDANNNNNNQNQGVIDLKCVAREIDSKDKTVCTFKFNAILSAAAHALLIKPGMWARIRLTIPIPSSSSSSSSSDFSASSNATALPVAEDGATPSNPFINNNNSKNAKAKQQKQQFQIVERQWTVTSVGGGSLFSLTIRHVPFDPKAKGEDGNFAVGGASHYLHTVADISTIKCQLLEVGGDFHLGALRSDISHHGGNVLWLTAGIGITPFFGFLAAVEQQQQFFGGFSGNNNSSARHNNNNNNNSHNDPKPFFTIVHLHNEKKHHALACEANIHKHLKSGVVQSMSLFLTQEERRSQSTSPANADGVFNSNRSTPVTHDGENKIVADDEKHNNHNDRQKYNISPNLDHSAAAGAGALPRALTTIPGRRMSAEDILTALTSQQIASCGNPSKFMVMMCGPEEFMDFCMKVLIEEGKVPKSAIFKEKFM